MLKDLFTVTGGHRFQNFFERLYTIALVGMNFDAAADPQNSGEKNALIQINKKFKNIENLVVFDVGANVGHYSLLLNETFGEKATIHSFEPAKKTFDKLKFNLSKTSHITLHNFGFGSENKKVILYSDSDESGLASLYKRRLQHFNIDMKKKEEIEIKTIDDFCKTEQIQRINFLKLDVEGNELKVMEGASKMLKAGVIDYIQFEFGGCHIDSRTFFQDFFYFLKDNYIIYRIVKNGLVQLTHYKQIYEVFLTANYLAEKNTNLSRLL